MIATSLASAALATPDGAGASATSRPSPKGARTAYVTLGIKRDPGSGCRRSRARTGCTPCWG